MAVEDPSENSYWIRRIGGEQRDQSSSNVGIGGAFVMDRVELECWKHAILIYPMQSKGKV